MTIERAIQILDPEHREHYESIEPVNEACRMGMEALKRTQWISVEDRLPENDGEYLVYTKHGFMDKWPYIKFCGQYWGCRGAKITYWMPLPEPPEEVNNG